MRRAWVIAGLVAGCTALPPPPGSEPLGAWVFVAEPVLGLPDGGAGELRPDGRPACELPEVSLAPFRFDAVFTRDPETGAAWLTLGGGYPRDAGWDGQVLDSVASARRLFPSCRACPATVATERLTVALLSLSQSEAVGRRCPPAPLDGGVPRPNGDGGLTGPRTGDEGFDALYACGELGFSVALVEPAASDSECEPACADCAVRFTLVGERR
ncbi:MAG: hypothetical protein INH41_00290 [Myxococcaceae bacterium]|jgi:hypothetical protein|nr:hypothetical protein [Myxococcaceae bacterium]